MGRGSSSAGGNGYMVPEKILSTEDMISNRMKNVSGTDQVLATAKDIVDQYGNEYALNGNFQVAKLKGNSRTMAYYDQDGNIAINEKYFDSDKMDMAYDACVESGFHPSRGDKTGLQATAAHEYGHALTDMAGKNIGKDLRGAADQIVNDAMKSMGASRTGRQALSQFRSKISGYAKQNNAETIAEAFSDVYCNGNGAKRESRAVVDALNKYLKK